MGAVWLGLCKSKMSDLAPLPAARRRILVVEDEPAVCELLSEIIEAEGFATHCVSSDRAAYEALRSTANFACMVVDVNLGSGTTGYDVARYAREIAPELPVAYVSGQTSPASHRTNGVPGSLFVPKPFTASELMEQLRRLIGDNDD